MPEGKARYLDCKCVSVVDCMPIADGAMLKKGCREFILPMFLAVVAAGAAGIAVPATPQYDGVLTRFTVSPAIAAFFRITAMVIATDNQLMEITPFNADLFIPGNQSNVQIMTPVQANSTVELTVTNLDGVNAHAHSSAFKGYVKKYS
jgi:hypothetical protein